MAQKKSLMGLFTEVNSYQHRKAGGHEGKSGKKGIQHDEAAVAAQRESSLAEVNDGKGSP